MQNKFEIYRARTTIDTLNHITGWAGNFKNNGAYANIGDWKGTPSQKANGGSLIINLDGPMRGNWKDFASEDHGDIFTLFFLNNFGGHYACKSNPCPSCKKAMAATEAHLNSLFGVTPSDARGDKSAVSPDKTIADRRKMAENEEKINQIIFNKKYIIGGPDFINTPSHQYLLGRAINITELRSMPFSIMHHSSMAYDNNFYLPAMIAAIHQYQPNGTMTRIGLHRTYLEQSASGQWQKYSGGIAKKFLFKAAGGFIPISRGGQYINSKGDFIRGASWSELTEQDDMIYIAEGIEDALSYAICNIAARVIAAPTVSSFGQIFFPPSIKNIIILGDNDKPDSPAYQLLEKQKRIILARNPDIFCNIIRPPKEFKDYNDWLMRGEK